jgi:hypothetical protein
MGHTTVTSEDGRRTRIRRYTLDQFASVADYLVAS